ncbi:MAG: S-adenosyl-l-methionine hydroxide adenosyltransferase family protein, partial [Pirellulales bacterium]
HRNTETPKHRNTETPKHRVMARPIITLTTDFGASSPYSGAVRGVILSINGDARLIDITHAIPAQNVRHGAIVLAQVTPLFPAGTIHLAVVDPGVGSDRPIVCAEIGGQTYVAPDNGLLSRLAAVRRPSKIITVSRSEFWRDQVSPTFHGRDIMAPVAARLSLGLAPDALGPRQEGFLEFAWPETRIVDNRIEGEVVSVDSFGNLITNISAEMLRPVPTDSSLIIRCDEHETVGLFTSYAEQPEMTFVALIGSSGYLELAIVNESAATMLSLGEGAPVTLIW